MTHIQHPCKGCRPSKARKAKHVTCPYVGDKSVHSVDACANMRQLGSVEARLAMQF